MVGCFVGGWAADSIGRINGIFYAAIVALIGGILQASSQGAAMIIVARVVTGLGTGGKYQKPTINVCALY
jgi:MFS family permease